MLGVEFNEFSLVIDSFGVDGTRPVAGPGASATPGNNTYGSYVSIIAGASVTDDVYGIYINVNSIGANGVATDTLATIGFDAAGGTSFTDSITDLLVSCAVPAANSTGGIAPGVEYYFPIFIKAGTSIGFKLSQNNASPVAGKCFVRLYCQPSRPELLRMGSKVVTYGSTPASSSGTAITPGTTSDGAFVALGTIATDDHPWYWQLGFGLNQTIVSTTVLLYCDLAVGQTGAKKTPILNQMVQFNTNEQGSKGIPRDGFGMGAPAELVYGRAQCSGTVPAGSSMAAYGVI